MSSQVHRPSDAARGGEIVTIVIGVDKMEYLLHKGLLMQHSEFFERAFKEAWQEADDRMVRLEDIDVDAFDIFVDWLYLQNLRTLGELRLDEELSYVKAYVFSDRFQAIGFKKALLELFVQYFIGDENLPYYDSVIYAFGHLPSGDIFLELLVDAHCSRYEPELDVGHELKARERLPNDFLVRVMIQYSKHATRVVRKSKIYQIAGHAEDTEHA